MPQAGFHGQIWHAVQRTKQHPSQFMAFSLSASQSTKTEAAHQQNAMYLTIMGDSKNIWGDCATLIF